MFNTAKKITDKINLFNNVTVHRAIGATVFFTASSAVIAALKKDKDLLISPCGGGYTARMVYPGWDDLANVRKMIEEGIL